MLALRTPRHFSKPGSVLPSTGDIMLFILRPLMRPGNPRVLEIMVTLAMRPTGAHTLLTGFPNFHLLAEREFLCGS